MERMGRENVEARYWEEGLFGGRGVVRGEERLASRELNGCCVRSGGEREREGIGSVNSMKRS